nr:hypothetical protein [Brevundimonas diminuta]
MLDLDPIPDRHPRLIVWCGWFRREGYPLRDIAHLFNISIGELIEAGVEP